MTRSTSEIFARAAELIELHGHAKRRFGSPQVGFCATGAVLWTCQRENDGWDTNRFGALSVRMDEAAFGRWGLNTPRWNDMPERTPADAVAFLREFVEES